MKKYLIADANGQVGSQLVAQLNGKAEVFAADRNELDIDISETDISETTEKVVY